MSEEKGVNLKDFLVADGDSWSAGRALSVGVTVIDEKGNEENIKFANEWDEEVPYAKEWRESLGVKIDFSGISLDTKPEDIQKKKDEVLQNYPEPTQEDMAKSYALMREAGSQYSANSYVHWMYGAVMNGLRQSSNEGEYQKILKYAGKIIDNVVDYQNYRMGEKDSYDTIYNIKSPYRKTMDKILGREGHDPYAIIKDGLVHDFGDNTLRVTRGLKKVKDILPRTVQEVRKFDFEKQNEYFAQQFKEEHQGDEKYNEYKKQLKGYIVQRAIRDNVSNAFEEQLAEHMQALEDEKRKEELANKKEEIRTRLDEMKKSKDTEPLSGVVIADRIAEHIIANKKLFEKDKELGIVDSNTEYKNMTPEEGKELARKIQKNVVQQRKNVR